MTCVYDQNTYKKENVLEKCFPLSSANDNQLVAFDDIKIHLEQSLLAVLLPSLSDSW